MSLSITENLQEIQPQATFVDTQNQFTQTTEEVSTLNPTLPNLAIYRERLSFPDISLGNVDEQISAVPFSPDEIKVQLTGKIDQIKAINSESLLQTIPENPGADTFKDLTIASEIQNTVSSLTQDLTGSLSIGEVPPAAKAIFGEFEEFVTKAGMLPVRTLDALFKVFKKLLDKLSNPDELLSTIGAEQLREVFVNQIRSLAEKLPSEAIKRIELNLQQRSQLLTEYKTLLEAIEPNTLTKEQIKAYRQTLRIIAKDIEAIEARNAVAVANLQQFELEKFKTELSNLAKLESNNPNVGGLSILFNRIKDYISTLQSKITEITGKLREFTQKIPQLIEEGINKAEQVATKVTGAIAEKLGSAKELLNKLTAYLQETINKLKNFVEDTSNKTTQFVKPVKEKVNQFSAQAVGTIDELANTIEDKTQKLGQSLDGFNTKVKTDLNREQLEKKIKELLDKITSVLDSPAVNKALAEAESGMKTITDSLQKVTLEPAFQAVVSKSREVERQLKEVDVSQLSTVQKTALKVGCEVIRQVDVPGTVNPELQAAFEEILAPLENIVTSIEVEFYKIDRRVNEFEPGRLATEFLDPYIDTLVNKLKDYKPSTLLKPVYDFYQELLGKLNVIDPRRLLDKLEELYQKLVNAIASLEPSEITKFLNQQLSAVRRQLDELPVERIVNKVKEALNSVDKLMSSLGLGDVLKSDFWKNLEEILTFSVADKIKSVEEIKDRLVSKINAIEEQKLQEELTKLQEAIASYVKIDAVPELGIDISGATAAAAQLQVALEQLQLTWNQQQPKLNNFQPPVEIYVDYKDLQKRLAGLFQAATKPDNLVENVEIILRANPARIKPLKTEREKLLGIIPETQEGKEQLIDQFKKVIPQELEQQFIKPIKEILQAIDTLLAQPRLVLNDVKNVIQTLEDAPRRLLTILERVATTLGATIRSAINAVKEAIDDLGSQVTDALKQIYEDIIKTLKVLSPRRILNSFDDSDFKSLEGLIDKLVAAKDKVSQYILSQLPERVRELLPLKNEGAKKAVISALNDLLLDSDFYSQERFQEVKLTVDAQVSLLETAENESDLAHRNRSLLEAAYPTEIVKSLEAIFPYFKEKLAQLYPTELVNQLNILHGSIVSFIEAIPQALGNALNQEYREKVLKKMQKLRESIDKIFKALRGRLVGLQSELEIGLEDVADAFDRLLNALPV